MALFEVFETLNFLLLEVIKQVKEVLIYIEHPDEDKFNKIIERDDYVDNLKSTVENRCFSKLAKESDLQKQEINQIRASHTIGINLEKIGDYAVNILNQTQYLSSTDFLKTYPYKEFFNEITHSMEPVMEGLKERNLSTGLKVCRGEFVADELYKNNFKRIIQELNKQNIDKEDLVTTLFIFHYLERMGDSLLNIGEAIIFSAIGEKLKIHQYEGLRETLEELSDESDIERINFESIWGTRSGCRIGKVDDPESDNRVIFKEGSLKKLKKEKENILEWEKIEPGLAPKVVGFQENHQDDPNASILMELLSGQTLKEMVFVSHAEDVKQGVNTLKEKMFYLWEKTRKDAPVCVNYVQQIYDRLEEVYKVHPNFKSNGFYFGTVNKKPFEELLKDAYNINEMLPAPWQIFIHGDFNIDNVIYEFESGKIHYIDLNRSKFSDYIQDTSVFLISGFRMPLEDLAIRQRINEINIFMLNQVRNYARENNDKTFDIRLALALARSFITSTRFELNRLFAKTLYQRGTFLLEKITAHQGIPWEEFTFDDEIVLY